MITTRILFTWQRSLLIKLFFPSPYCSETPSSSIPIVYYFRANIYVKIEYVRIIYTRRDYALGRRTYENNGVPLDSKRSRTPLMSSRWRQPHPGITQSTVGIDEEKSKVSPNSQTAAELHLFVSELAKNGSANVDADNNPEARKSQCIHLWLANNAYGPYSRVRHRIDEPAGICIRGGGSRWQI